MHYEQKSQMSVGRIELLSPLCPDLSVVLRNHLTFLALSAPIFCCVPSLIIEDYGLLQELESKTICLRRTSCMGRIHTELHSI